MFDYHIHSTVSFDAHGDMEACAKHAVEAGLQEICFTEHQEIDYPYKDVNHELDFSLYEKELEKARKACPEITIRQGMETGLIPGSLEKIAADVRAHPELDFVIGSQHVADNRDPWYGDFFDGKTLREGQRDYLEEMLYCIENFDEFDVVGHIGYVDKYLGNYEFGGEAKPFTYADFPETLDAILKSVISRGKGLEINTSNYYIYNYPTPHPSIIKRYAELGGEVATTGSDAHFAEVVGGKLAEATELMKDCGLRYVCTYTKRVPAFHKLK